MAAVQMEGDTVLSTTPVAESFTEPDYCEQCGQPTGDVDVFLCATCQTAKDEREAGYRED